MSKKEGGRKDLLHQNVVQVLRCNVTVSAELPDRCNIIKTWSMWEWSSAVLYNQVFSFQVSSVASASVTSSFSFKRDVCKQEVARRTTSDVQKHCCFTLTKNKSLTICKRIKSKVLFFFYIDLFSLRSTWKLEIRSHTCRSTVTL